MSAVAAAPPVYLGRPPEPRERAGAAYRTWWSRHPGLARGLGRMVWACHLVAPGRARRFAAADWALLGYAAGLGFTVAEDSVRRLRQPGLLEALLGGSGLSGGTARAPASARTEARAMRASAGFTEQQVHFAAHAQAQAAARAAEARLEQLANSYRYTASDFTGTRSSSPSTRAAPPPTTRARPTLLMSSVPRPRLRERPTTPWTACCRTSAFPGTSTTIPACGSPSRTAAPACVRTSSRPPVRA